ncbi:MAG: glycerophosphodiester phosphodiesterase family protein [Pseudomonadales bacterium]
MVELLLAAALVACDGTAAAPLIVAHRGGMDSGFPENTLPAFRHAAAAGADLIELDLRTTRDGHLVVLHDPRVDRTTDGRGRVQELDLEALMRLDAGGGTRVPTLLEALQATRDLNVELLFDLKTGAPLNHGDLADAVRRFHDPARVWFGVRTLADRQRLAALLPQARFLGFVPDVDDVDGFLAAGMAAIRLWPAWLTSDPGLVERIHGTGAQVWVTAGRASAERLAALVELGVDAVLTDHPAAAVDRLRCR